MNAMPQDEQPIPGLPKLTPWRIALLGIFILLILIYASLGAFTEYLWFVHDARQPKVFTLQYSIRGLLFAFSFAISVAVMWFSLSRALKVALVYIRVPETLGERIFSNLLTWFQDSGPSAARILVLIFSFFIASGFSGEWQTFLLARNGGEFGKVDPIFGLDLGFFVFKLPWYQAIVGLAQNILIATGLLTLLIYVGMQLLARMSKIELSQPTIRQHLTGLLGLFTITIAVALWLARFEVGLEPSPQFTGAGFAGIQAMQVKTVFAVLFGLAGFASLAFWKSGKPYAFAIRSFLGVFVLYVLGVTVYPALVQRLYVEPNKLSVEGPFARNAIVMTRFGYGLDAIEVKESTIRETPTKEDLLLAKSTLENMRLWDYDTLRRTLDGVQTFRPYYEFFDVDVDRYPINGKNQLVLVSPRDIRLNGLSASARTWINERLQYTHGFGLAMVPANRATSNGQPQFLAKDIPPSSQPGFEVTQPRTYFGDYREVNGAIIDEYALVGTKIPEFDYVEQNTSKNYRWTGDRGVPVGGWLSRLALSIVFGDGNLLVSPNITADTRLLFHRSVLDRARRVFPFLKFDSDPYAVLFNGKIVYLLDGYTTTDRVPYSAHLFEAGVPENLNYIRNSVKVVVDAYSGEMHAYAIEKEPILTAYRKIYPNLIEDIAAMPEGLSRHFRYPEDLFVAQSSQLTQYHVTDSNAFLNNEDAWEIPTERGRKGIGVPIEPYYVQMSLPERSEDEYLLILPFTPRQKINMIGWLAARCDGEHYGKLVLYKYPRGSNMPGPSQMEAMFNQDKEVADINRQLNNDQSEIVVGNLLVVPVGFSVLYVEPLFLQSRAQGIPQVPELKKVILAVSGRIVVADTYGEALTKLFGDDLPDNLNVQGIEKRSEGEPTPAPRPVEPKPTLPPTGASVSKSEILKLQELADKADAALRNGDFAKFGELQRALRGRLKELAK